MPEKIFALPPPGHDVAIPWSPDVTKVVTRAEYLASLVESVPDDWSDVSGRIEPGLDVPRPVPDLGYDFYRHDRGVRVTDRRVSAGTDPGAQLETATVALLVDGRPPSWVAFRDTGFDDHSQFLVARSLAIGFVRRGYLGWLNFNNGRGREYAVDLPAEVRFRLAPWQRLVSGRARVTSWRPTPPAVVLSWDERYGGTLAQLDPVLRACQLACEEVVDAAEWRGEELSR